MIIWFDLETTGLDKNNDKIIEIALVKFDENTFEIIDTYSTFINPQIPIPDLISNLTNIHDWDVENAPTIDEVKQEVLDFIGNTALLWHNIFFDRDFFVKNNIHVEHNNLIDTFFLANFLCPYEKSLNLEMLCKSFWVGFSWAHRALNDVHATIKLLEKLLEKFKKLPQEKKDILQYLFSLSEDQHIHFCESLLFENTEKSIKFETFEEKILWVLKSKLTVDEDAWDRKIKKQKLSKLFSSLWNVESRENQLKMAEIVENTLEFNKKSVIEAPTGLGKSFAYLLPSIQYCVKNKQKIYVSTNTKNLQDQLFEKDLEFLAENLDIPFNYAKLKWKSNYISTKSYFDEIILWDLWYSKLNFFLKLTLWLYDTKHWELDELNFFWVEYSLLRFINSEGLFIMSEENPYKNYEFYLFARGNVENADVVIINHSLLFSDINSQNPFLWKMKYLVIDEAHNIEDSVTQSVQQRINEKSVKDIFDVVENILTKKNIKKIDFINQKETFLSSMDILMDYCASYVESKTPSGHNYKTTLVKDDFFDDIDLQALAKKIELSLIDIVDILAVKNEFDFTKEITLINNLSANIKIFLDITKKDFIKTASYNDRTGVSFEYTLLNPWNYLYEKLWTGLQWVILTSATLQISGSFNYLEKILHLKEFDYHIFESDFDYKKQATLFVPTDLWSIKNNSEKIVDFLWKFYHAVRGNTLTLLTSFSIIKKIYTTLNSDLVDQWVHLYPQWVWWSKSKLLSFYLENANNSILLWTDSFWEWVDIPGDTLKYLVIHKFPFGVPSDPVFQARSEFFEDSFRDYAIPKAIIKLKQWFWRLIRSKTDTGIVVLLDDRLYSTAWWEKFLDAFPKDINKKYVWSQSFIDILEKKNNKN